MSKKPTTQSEREVQELDARQEKALAKGLQTLPTPKTKPSFNAQVLLSLTSGQDFAPWQQQVVTRLRWMALPALCGFVLTLTFANWYATRQPLARPDTQGSYAYRGMIYAPPPPPLPPLPAKLTSPPSLPPLPAKLALPPKPMPLSKRGDK